MQERPMLLLSTRQKLKPMYSFLKPLNHLEILQEFLAPFCMKPKCYSTCNDRNRRINHNQSFHISLFSDKSTENNCNLQVFSCFSIQQSLKKRKRGKCF